MLEVIIYLSVQILNITSCSHHTNYSPFVEVCASPIARTIGESRNPDYHVFPTFFLSYLAKKSLIWFHISSNALGH